MRFLSLSYQANSQPEEALATLRNVSGVTGSRRPLSFLGHALARAGQEAEARSMLDELRTQATRQYVSPWAFAHVHLGLGDLGVAMDRLEDAHAERCPILVFLLRPEWDPLRPDPRFQALLQKMNFPATAAD